jgi:hypothetical protein
MQRLGANRQDLPGDETNNQFCVTTFSVRTSLQSFCWRAGSCRGLDFDNPALCGDYDCLRAVAHCAFR